MDELLLSTDPLDPSTFDAYNIQITDEWESEGGFGYTGDVLKDGSHIFSFENEGVGDANKYLCPSSEAKSLFREFEQLCTEQFPDRFEPVDYGVIYLEVRDIQIK
jgi:hypothetical protein